MSDPYIIFHDFQQTSLDEFLANIPKEKSLALSKGLGKTEMGTRTVSAMINGQLVSLDLPASTMVTISATPVTQTWQVKQQDLYVALTTVSDGDGTSIQLPVNVTLDMDNGPASLIYSIDADAVDTIQEEATDPTRQRLLSLLPNDRSQWQTIVSLSDLNWDITADGEIALCTDADVSDYFTGFAKTYDLDDEE